MKIAIVVLSPLDSGAERCQEARIQPCVETSE